MKYSDMISMIFFVEKFISYIGTCISIDNSIYTICMFQEKKLGIKISGIKKYIF